MNRESSPNPEKDCAGSSENWELNISDGMDPIDVPPRITKDELRILLGGKLPEQISPDSGGEFELELEQ